MPKIDFFLKIDGIEGESKDAKHSGEIQLDSWSFGEHNTGSFAYGGGGGAGKVQMEDFNFNMTVNKASPKLFLACATGQHIPKATLTCRKAGGDQQDFYKITFSDLLVSKFETSGSANEEGLPTEAISMNFAKIEYEYKEQKEDGSLGGPVKTGYDLKKMQKV
jgi:type VI secretion system secreted protein Hcp